MRVRGVSLTSCGSGRLSAGPSGVPGGEGENERTGVGGREGGTDVHVREQMEQLVDRHLPSLFRIHTFVIYSE